VLNVLKYLPSRFGVLLLCAASALANHAWADNSVRIGTGDWLPYVEQQREDGGALPRLVREVFEAAGYRVEYVYYPWDRNLKMLEDGTLDAILPYLCSTARQRVSTCSDPLVSGDVVLFQRADQVLNWSKIEDLRAFRIATTLGFAYGTQFDAALEQNLLQVQQSGKEETGFRLLSLGRVDFYPQDRAAGYAMINRLFSPEQRQQITHHPTLLHREPLHVLFRKNDPRADTLRQVFNDGLRRLQRSGELARLQQALNEGRVDQWRLQP
jgi:polar amino acid transport system substrate-binding protein